MKTRGESYIIWVIREQLKNLIPTFGLERNKAFNQSIERETCVWRRKCNGENVKVFVSCLTRWSPLILFHDWNISSEAAEDMALEEPVVRYSLFYDKLLL